MHRILAFVLLWMCSSAVAAEECRTDRVQLRGSWGETAFAVEVADTPQTRSQGLMFRESMPRGAGMLFVYDEPRRASFWMKNTLIPLDMLFADRDGVIQHIHHMAIPGDLTPIEGGNDVFAVLEINGGLAQRYGIETGTEMRHPIFSQVSAFWPC